MPDACHAVGDGDGGQAAATTKGIVADAGHAVGDGDGCQAAAIIECPVTDSGHAVGDDDGGQVTATRVFVSDYNIVTCSLNGRKVMTKILYRLEKMKI